MSQLLESCKERFFSANVPAFQIISGYTEALLDYSRTDDSPMRRFMMHPDDWLPYVNELIVVAAATAQCNGSTTLHELSVWLKKLSRKYPAFAKAINHIHGLANGKVAAEISWNEEEIAILTEEVRGQVQYKGDTCDDPIRERIDSHVSRWLDQLFGLNL